MKITVTIKPKSSQAKVEEVGEDRYKVWVRSAPVQGQANEEMLRLLAKHFQVAPSNVRIIIGKTAREKLILINR